MCIPNFVCTLAFLVFLSGFFYHFYFSTHLVAVVMQMTILLHKQSDLSKRHGNRAIITQKESIVRKQWQWVRLEFTFRGEADAGEEQRSRGSRSKNNISIWRGKEGKPINNANRSQMKSVSLQRLVLHLQICYYCELFDFAAVNFQH